ncbi:MAG: uridine kinase [Bdellovibrionaceae bacterium]|jgi:uridine kinase|nr:uridine kinase [Pseudobdellovibrionaceae bacterium]
MIKKNVTIKTIVDQILAACPNGDMQSKIISIDGCGGAGKSTLAVELSNYFDYCSVVHTDDFASPENPLNWHERMIEQVLKPLAENKLARFQRYDWNAGRLLGWLTVEPQNYIILEGVSSSRIEFRPYLSFSVFVNTDRDIRLKRGLERDGLQALAQWKEWMREEDEYIKRDCPSEFADCVINGNFKI